MAVNDFLILFLDFKNETIKQILCLEDQKMHCDELCMLLLLVYSFSLRTTPFNDEKLIVIITIDVASVFFLYLG
jgi:hypothetical protein